MQENQGEVKIIFSWDVTPCSVVHCCTSFEKICCLHVQSKFTSQCLPTLTLQYSRETTLRYKVYVQGDVTNARQRDFKAQNRTATQHHLQLDLSLMTTYQLKIKDRNIRAIFLQHGLYKPMVGYAK